MTLDVTAESDKKKPHEYDKRLERWIQTQRCDLLIKNPAEHVSNVKIKSSVDHKNLYARGCFQKILGGKVN